MQEVQETDFPERSPRKECRILPPELLVRLETEKDTKRSR